jgi:hypothetical protein
MSFQKNFTRFVDNTTQVEETYFQDTKIPLEVETMVSNTDMPII